MVSVISAPEIKGKPPRFIQNPKSQTIPEGNKLIIECKVTGEPMPDLSWSHNNKCIDERNDIKIEYDRKIGISRVIIERAFIEDAGNYRYVPFILVSYYELMSPILSKVV